MGEFRLSFNDEEAYKQFKLHCTILGTTVKDRIWDLMINDLKQFNDKKTKLDSFFDNNQIQKPEIDDDFESKIKPYLKTRSQKSLELLNQNYFRGNYFIKALLELNPDLRLSFDTTDYLELWRKHRF